MVKNQAKKTINDDLKALLVHLNAKVDKIDNSSEKIAKKCERNTEGITSLKESNKRLISRVSTLETEVRLLTNSIRRKNLILHKIKDEDSINSELHKYVAEKFDEAGIDASGISEVKRIKSVAEKRPVLVSFIVTEHTKTVFHKYKVLDEKTGIIIANDVGKADRDKYAKFKKQSELIAAYKRSQSH